MFSFYTLLSNTPTVECIEYDVSKVDTNEPLDEIESIGFDATLLQHIPAIETKYVLTLSVDGMTCATCSGAIERGLKKLNGVTSATVSLLSNTATVEFIQGLVNEQDIIDEIEDIGFSSQIQSCKKIKLQSENIKQKLKVKQRPKTTKKKAIIEIDGMTCATCSGAVEKALKQLNGVESMYAVFDRIAYNIALELLFVCCLQLLFLQKSYKTNKY